MDLELMVLVAQYKYALMVPAVVIFGPTVSLVAGALLRLDVLSLLPTCIALAGGELGGDMLWYWLGKRYGDSFVQKFGKYVGISESRTLLVKSMYGKYQDSILFTSKLTAGFGFAPAVLFTAGFSEIPFGRYMAINVIGQVIWTTALLSIGYFLGHLYAQIGSIFEMSAFIALIIIFLAIFVGFNRYAQSALSGKQT